MNWINLIFKRIERKRSGKIWKQNGFHIAICLNLKSAAAKIMSDTQFSAERFLSSSPLLNMPNPLVNETLAHHRILFWQVWQLTTVGAMLDCAIALKARAKPNRGAEFVHQWEYWQRALMDTIEELFGSLFDIGRANVDCAPPNPATWACELVYRLLLENFVCPNGRDHVADNWIKHACFWAPVRVWASPIGVGIYGVSGSDEPIRESDEIIPVLRQIFEQEILGHLHGLRQGALLRLAMDGSKPVSENEPGVTLQDLTSLAPRDVRRHYFVYVRSTKLRQEISAARRIARNRKGLSIETVRRRFPLLGEAEDASIEEFILKNPNGTSDATAAKEILLPFAGSISPASLDRYTRRPPDVSSNSKKIADRQPFRVLAPEYLHDFEELLVTRNRGAEAPNRFLFRR